jgi:predicted transport protein
VDVAYPFLLELYKDYANKVLSGEDLLKAVRLVESYVFRRAICAIPTNSMNKTFANLGKSLKKDRYLESIEAAFLLLQSYRRFPKDEEFKRELKIKDLYNFRSRSYWLRRLENHGRKERVPVDECTIEHILPQCDNSSDKVPAVWREALGDDWENVWETYRHTLGNLTLTAYNAEYSNRGFTEKCSMEGGFAQSPLRLNRHIAAEEVWNREAIEGRADYLSAQAVSVWQAPVLDSEILSAYKPTSQTLSSSYTIEDHPHLASSVLRDLFNALRIRIMELDPVVSEEFLKLYVAYKAETNFVDIVPQAKRLKLTLNMLFHEIDDPRGICVDVTGLGRWGNGDVQVTLSSQDDLTYVLGLIRQSFERQMGNGSDV